MRRSAGVFLIGLAAALAPRAAAQTEEELERRALPVERAREVAWRFLTQGEAAPHPDLTRAELDEARCHLDWTYDFLGLASRWFLLRGLELKVAPDGFVHQYVAARLPRVLTLAPDGSKRSPEERAAEVADRTHHDEADLRGRALAFLRGRYPDFERRVFVDDISRRDGLIHLFVLKERPAPGQLATYHNSIAIEVSAETGEVLSYYASNVRAVVEAPPPIDEPRARAVALAARPGAEVERARLGFLFVGGAPRAVWSVLLVGPGDDKRAVFVDANDGRLCVRDEH